MSGAARQSVLVSGAGLGGALMAVYLARAGHEVRIFERRADPRRGEAGRARSINLAISTRGIHALEQVGLADEVLRDSVPMRGRMIHAASGGQSFQPYGTRADQAIRSVSRLGLNIALIDAAEKQAGVSIQFGKRTRGVDLDRPALLVEDEAGGGRGEVTGDRIIAADGAFSAVRGRMQKLDRFDYRQSYLAHGYKELSIPAAAEGGFRLEPNALHIWPRGGFMMIALPNSDGSFTCTLFWPFAGDNGLDRTWDAAEIRSHFERHFADALPLMPRLAEEFLENPVGSLVTVRCRPWHYADKVALLGDACHAVVPFYGQGANAAFEDCVVLDDCLRGSGGDWGVAFAEYDRRRQRNVDSLADLAIANFVEMRDHVSSKSFLLKKRGEKLLHRLFPRWFVPLYSMVTFSRVPYAEATARARRQWRVVRWTLTGIVLALLTLLALALVYGSGR